MVGTCADGLSLLAWEMEQRQRDMPLENPRSATDARRDKSYTQGWSDSTERPPTSSNSWGHHYRNGFDLSRPFTYLVIQFLVCKKTRRV